MQRLWLALMLLACSAASAQDRRAPARKPRTTAPRQFAPPPTFRPEELELFFPDAVAKVGPRPTKRTSSLVAPPIGAETSPMAATPDRNATDNAVTAISAETLESEIKAAAGILSAAVKSPAEFRARTCRDARRELATLAVCFGAVARHKGPVRWSDSAAAAELYFLAAADACREPTDSALQAARQASTQLAELLRGDTIEAPAPTETHPPADLAALMQRLEIAQQQRLSPWTAASAFDEHRDGVIHEAQIVALLADAIRAPGHGFSDDAGYRAHAEALRSAAAKVEQAVASGALPAIQSAAAQLGQSCDRCHEDYRG